MDVSIEMSMYKGTLRLAWMAKSCTNLLHFFFKTFGTIHPFLNINILVSAAKIRDHETGLVSEPFSWFQSLQYIPRLT